MTAQRYVRDILQPLMAMLPGANFSRTVFTPISKGFTGLTLQHFLSPLAFSISRFVIDRPYTGSFRTES
ncbi:hypothetical protein TNCV_2179461 [Trichonephila clavipes]|uniref:Uncharacterized protein n=1 Tax=Trichonephila clavipes TaxID=2585209 RepID=A0A8X6VUJ7_TRICX|nr:hypothetical protein TNCV_2179461 [Trichonephila clavipes]